jgi:hypothetical protein
MKFLKLLLEDRPGAAVSCVVPATTAEYFGWDKAFPEFDAVARTTKDGRKSFGIFRQNRDPRYPGGTRLRICRVASKHGQPARMTHTFRMQGSFANRHLRQLAVVAGDRFEWMDTKQYRRTDRKLWLSFD